MWNVINTVESVCLFLWPTLQLQKRFAKKTWRTKIVMNYVLSDCCNMLKKGHYWKYKRDFWDLKPSLSGMKWESFWIGLECKKCLRFQNLLDYVKRGEGLSLIGRGTELIGFWRPKHFSWILQVQCVSNVDMRCVCVWRNSEQMFYQISFLRVLIKTLKFT